MHGPARHARLGLQRVLSRKTVIETVLADAKQVIVKLAIFGRLDPTPTPKIRSAAGFADPLRKKYYFFEHMALSMVKRSAGFGPKLDPTSQYIM
jgi:hypothetical protein